MEFQNSRILITKVNIDDQHILVIATVVIFSFFNFIRRRNELL